MLRRKIVLGVLLAIAPPFLAACAGGSSAETESLDIQDVLVDGEHLEYAVLDRLGAVVGEGALTVMQEGEGWLRGQRFDESAPVGGRGAAAVPMCC